MIDANDRLWKDAGNTGARPKTKNEERLAAKIARKHEKGRNSATAFNQKLSTRLARTYATIVWEDTDLLNMVRRAKPELLPDGTYDQNGAERHADLTRRLLGRSLGQLRLLTETKAIAFVAAPAEHSSTTCHQCQQTGDYDIFSNSFMCQNSSCTLHHVDQNGDVNAAKNFARTAIGME